MRTHVVSKQMGTFGPHASVERYQAIALEHHLPLRVVSYTQCESDAYMRIPRLMRIFMDPWRFAASVREVKGGTDLAILRDFLTIPLALSAPALRGLPSSLLLVSNHNLQRAHTSALQRAALRYLASLGFRFLAPESSEGWREIGIEPSLGRVTAIPLAVSEAQLRAPRKPRPERRVGVVGRPRAEKNSEATVAALRDVLDCDELRDVRLLVARPGMAGPRSSVGDRIEYADTTNRVAYLRALARCSVVVYDYSKSDYEFRCSASILDAVSEGAVVVCPDFPVLREQISTPVRVGFAFRSRADLRSTVVRSLELARDPQGVQADYLSYRRNEGVTRALRRVAGLEPKANG